MTKLPNTFFKDYQAMLQTIEALKKDVENPFFKSNYVQLKDVLAEVKKVCVEHNFIFYQRPDVQDGKMILRTTIEHESGTKIEGNIEIVAKDTTDPQKIGGGITYMRRYSLTCMFGIEEVDDDGNDSAKKNNGNATLEVIVGGENFTLKEKPFIKTTSTAPASLKQVSMLRSLIEEKGKDESKLVTFLKIKTLEDITKAQASALIEQLMAAPKAKKLTPEEQEFEKGLDDIFPEDLK